MRCDLTTALRGPEGGGGRVLKQRLCTICGCGERAGKNNSDDVGALRSSGSGSE